MIKKKKECERCHTNWMERDMPVKQQLCVTCIQHYYNANCTGYPRSCVVALLITRLHMLCVYDVGAAVNK